MKINQVITEKSVSKQQQKFMGMVYAAKKGEKPASPDVAKAAKGMSKADARDFAKTKHKGLPDKVGEATGDKLGQVTSVSPSGDVTIKTPTGTEIKTKQDALLPGAQTGTVQMKPDAAGDALKPGTQVVSTESMDDSLPPIKADELKASIMNEVPPEHKAEIDKLVVAKPDGTVDYHRTLSNMSGAMFYGMDELLEMFIEWSKEAGPYMATPEFKQLPPDQQQAWKELAMWSPKLEKSRQELTKSAGEFDKMSNQLYAQKMGTDTAMPEDQSPGNMQSPIGGDQDHDEISKLLVQRLKKLAGL